MMKKMFTRNNFSRRQFHVLLKLVFTSMLSSMIACDDTYISSVPEFPVSMQLNLTTTYPTFKNSINQFIVFKKPVTDADRIGYGGLLVYSGFDGEYYAFDLACPYEAKQNIRITPNDLGQAVCDSCKSVYDLSLGLGNPISGPADEVLRRYKTSVDGDYLYIYK